MEIRKNVVRTKWNMSLNLISTHHPIGLKKKSCKEELLERKYVLDAMERMLRVLDPAYKYFDLRELCQKANIY